MEKNDNACVFIEPNIHYYIISVLKKSKRNSGSEFPTNRNHRTKTMRIYDNYIEADEE